MRIDKYLADNTELTRSLAKRELKSGAITCDGEVVKNPGFQVSEDSDVCWHHETVGAINTRYLMLNKPVNTICSNIDEVHPSVLGLIDLPLTERLRIAGRLDADTTGLVLLSEDGQWCHRITSPNYHCPKRYRVVLAEPLCAEAEAQFEAGVELHNDGLTRPATLTRISEVEVLLTISEGKYHQVKRMFAAVNNRVVGLHREQVGAIELDQELKPGEWRHLTHAEVVAFLS
ncbi:16S rRNA pseudouridine(516) synthase RsuA [Ferrimonas lipolytica]|uniref:Ribosomal small subunit pseudouridine synthase A n=1 Tax=Ferrimonas lipolytica TaxID=2724191 RepID=A0A6H1U9F4_9GAMM|nr:16S rRNA pseudouridine(516) synthase RsuA [Ferrimonas lipolytica]QIZ75458.1 16S rRNA pseudouridine(516) synthase RsuA [Ferrimonas lipolytica]